MKMPAEPVIAPLTPEEAGELAAIFKAARPGYIAHFHPFAFDEESVRAQLEGARRDRYWGIRCGGELAGIFMLRGFNDGYERPAFGVFIAEHFAGRGLARRALAEAEKWCRENGIAEMMLTVHRENTTAVRVYEEAGFVAADPGAATLLMAKRLSK